MMDKKNVKGGGEFNFLNEHVMQKRKLNVTKLLGFIIFAGMIFGLAACFVFFWARPYVQDFLEEYAHQSSESETFSGQFTSEQKQSDVVAEQINSVEDVNAGVVMLSINEENEWRSTTTDNHNFSCGLVLEADNDIKVLTSYDFVKNEQTVVAYISGKRYVGEVMSSSREYGLAIISIKMENESDRSVLKQVKCADIEEGIQYNIGDDIVFVGNPYGRERFMANGSLTSVGNAYNIVDVELEIITTDISNTGSMNGFVFNAQGQAVGMVNSVSDNSNVGENLITIVSFNGIKSYINKLLHGDRITYLGIYGKVVTNEVIESIDKDMPYGIYISNTEENSPAYVSGIMNGDIMVRFDGKEIRNFAGFTELLQHCESSDEVEVTVMRKGKDGYKEINYTVEIGGR